MWIPPDFPELSVTTWCHLGFMSLMHLAQMDDGGLAIIYYDKLKVLPVKLQTPPSTFEALMVKLVIDCARFLLVNIYWPSGIDIVAFLEELFDMEEFLSTTGGHPILLGDFICPGAFPVEVMIG